MADNVTTQTATLATVPTTTTFATDDITGTHYPISKIALGPLNTANLLDGDTTNGADVDVTRVIPGTTATALGKAEDTAHASGDTGVFILAVRKNAPGQLTSADGDYAALQTDRLENLRVTLGTERLSSGIYYASTFRTLGNAAATQNIFTFEIANAGTTFAMILALQLVATGTATLVAVDNAVALYRTSGLPSGGTTLSKVPHDTANTSSTNVTLRGATASDGGAATAITATAGNRISFQLAGRGHSMVGEFSDAPRSLLPERDDSTLSGLIVRTNEAILCRAENPTAANNATTQNYLINVVWQEFSLP